MPTMRKFINCGTSKSWCNICIWIVWQKSRYSCINFLFVAGSISLFLGDYSIKTFLCTCFGPFTDLLSLWKMILGFVFLKMRCLICSDNVWCEKFFFLVDLFQHKNHGLHSFRGRRNCTHQKSTFSVEEKIDDDYDFINDTNEIYDDVNLYRRLDPNNSEHYNTFLNQTRNPVSAVYEENKLFFDEIDPQPELYMPEGTENFEFENSSRFEKSVKKIRNSLKNFNDSNNSFFHSIIYGLMYN